MNINEIPLICTNFNQLSYLRNLVNQFHFYYPENPVIVLDNASTSPQVKDYYWKNDQITVYQFHENNSAENLKNFLAEKQFEYYIISDPDISIHPTTPPYFLEVFKELIDSGIHHAGFDLIYDDIPEWNKKKGWIAGNESSLHGEALQINYNGNSFTGFKAPIDTTFALYSSNNGGWSAPMPGNHWSNSIRLFKAHHLTWYLNSDYVNEEMKTYFSTCKRHDGGVSAGKNNYRPE